MLNEEEDWSRISPGWELSYKAGYIDRNGVYAGGSEILHLVGHNGKLFAALGYWKDTRNPFSGGAEEDGAWGQILRLDTPGGTWEVDLELGPNHVRPEMLASIKITTDAHGAPLQEPVSLLITGTIDPDDNRIHADYDTNIFVRSDVDESWERVTVYRGSGGVKAGSARAARVYRDRVTGVDRIFISLGSPGILSGVYDPTLCGKIRWDDSSESGKLDSRPLAIIEANGSLLFAAGSKIYQRTDGYSPTWQVVHQMEGEVQTDEGLAGAIFSALGGIRGLTRIDNPGDESDSLLFVWTSSVEDPGCLYRLDPNSSGGYDMHGETCIADAACYHLDARDIAFTIGGYNEMTAARDPRTGETAHLFGFETAFNDLEQRFPTRRAFRTKGLYKGAMFGVRDARGQYRYGEVNGPVVQHNLPLIAPRAFAVSPFESEDGAVIYFGGFDTNFRPTDDSAWILKAPLELALGDQLWSIPDEWYV